MDPASAVIGIVSFGFTVFGNVNKIRKAIKGAPRQVRALEESYVVVRVLLGKLQAFNTHAVTYTKDELACFELLYERAQVCLHDVDITVKKVLVQTPAVEARSTPQVRLRQWFLNKSDLEDLAKKMKEVQETLGAMIDLMQLNHLQFIAIHVTNDMRPSNLPSPEQSLTANSLSAPRYTGIGMLQCDHNCMCRCHARSLSSIIPRSLAPYLGQLLISKQLLHPAFTIKYQYISVPVMHGKPIPLKQASRSSAFWSRQVQIYSFLQGNSYSAHDILALGLLLYVLHKPHQGRSLTPSLQTNKAAIDVFRSIFNIDPMDALGDLLARRYGHSDEYVSHILASLQTTDYTVAQSSVFEVIWYAPLRYAIAFSPLNVEPLLADSEGTDTSAEPTLACAVRTRRVSPGTT